MKRKKSNLKQSSIIPLIICMTLLFSMTVFANSKPKLLPDRSPGTGGTCAPFIYDFGEKEYTLTVEKGTQMELMPYIRYHDIQKNKSTKPTKRLKGLDQCKGEKTFSIEDPEIAALSESGKLTAVKEGTTTATVTYKDLSFTFTLVVKAQAESEIEDVIKLRKAIALFNKGIKSQKSFTRKNRNKKLKQLSEVIQIERRLNGNNHSQTYKAGAYKGVCVVPDYSVFELKKIMFCDYCQSLDPTYSKSKCPFNVKSVIYEDGKLTIQLKDIITEDQLFGFKTHSDLEEDAWVWWNDREWASYFSGKKSKFTQAITYINFFKDGDPDYNLTCYRGRGIVKPGNDKIVMTTCLATKPGNPKKNKNVKLEPDRYRFVRVPYEGSYAVADNMKWLKGVSFNVK